MRSIQGRLRLGLIALLVVAGAVILQSSLWLFDSALRTIYLDDLAAESESLLLAVMRNAAADVDAAGPDPQRLNPRYLRSYSGWYYLVEQPGRSWRSRSLWDTTVAWPAQPGPASGLLAGPRGQRLLAYRAEYRYAGQPVIIQVARDYRPVLASLQRVQIAGALIVIVALAATLLLQHFTLRRALRPLEEARGQIAQLRRGDRQRLDAAAPVELEPLVAEINRLLTQTEATLQRSRTAVGNLGHALKTPLAVLTTLVERAELTAAPALQEQLREQLAQIGRRIGRELGRARLAGEVLPGGHFDCAAELPELCRTLAMIHPRPRISWTAPPAARLPWDREDLLELLGNLLDNACKWAAGEVRLRVERIERDGSVEAGWRLLVDDDGPGIAPAERERARTRGGRLDESHAGHGLGLGIVADIVEAWHGAWWLEQSPVGGLRVRIELPLPGGTLGGTPGDAVAINK